MKKTTILLSVLFLSVFATGCKSTSTPKVTKSVCELPQSKKVDEAFSTAQSSLSNRQCWGRFDAQFNALLNIAKGDPSKEHKAKFATFLKWSESTGIISKVQLKKKYTRYFLPQFASLPKNQSNCKTGQNIEVLTRAMDKEMLDKKRGILDALGQADVYNQTKSNRDTILLVVAAAGVACKVR
jgi:hypothetical protein